MCYKLKEIHYRTLEGKPLCNWCYRKTKKERCFLCNMIKIVSTRDKNKNPICKSCHSKNKKEKCSICGIIKVVNCRKIDGSPICYGCKRKERLRKCDDCGREAPLCKNKINGAMLCCSCSIWTSPKTLYKKFLNGAKRRDLPFNLCEEEFLEIINLPCYYCGSSHHIGIDRKNNSIGYTKSNSLPCCGTCNFMKGKLDFKPFIENISKIYKNTVLRKEL